MEPSSEQYTRADFQQRDALMTLLIAQASGQIQRLALLAHPEKVAVSKLMAIDRAMTIYARSTNPDSQVIASFVYVLESFSPLLRNFVTTTDAASTTSGVIDFLKSTLVSVTLPMDDDRFQLGDSRPPTLQMDCQTERRKMLEEKKK